MENPASLPGREKLAGGTWPRGWLDVVMLQPIKWRVMLDLKSLQTVSHFVSQLPLERDHRALRGEAQTMPQRRLLRRDCRRNRDQQTEEPQHTPLGPPQPRGHTLHSCKVRRLTLQ